MKKNILLICTIFLVNTAISQTDGEVLILTPPPPPAAGENTNVKVIHSDIYEFVGEEPEYPGGMTALYKYLGENIVYPEICVDSNIQGKVFVKYVVEKDGSVGDATIMNKGKTHHLLEKEAIRVIQAIPELYKPAKNKGKIVRYYFKVPINFKLTGSETESTEK